MKKLYHKATVHPSPPLISDHLAFLPATILTLAAALSPEDREVLAYLISCSSASTPPASFPNFSGKQRRKSAKGADHAPLFGCSCFGCYMSYWVRWDESPNRQLIHEIIDAFEDWLAQSNKGGKKGKRDKRNKKGGSNKQHSGELKRTELLVSSAITESSELNSVGESSDGASGGGGGAEAGGSGGGGGERVADEEKGSVRRFVSFIGERIWGAWGQ